MWASSLKHDIFEQNSGMNRAEDYGFITVREVARRSSMSEKSIRNFIRNETLPHYRNSKSGKIWMRWIEFVDWMERRRSERKKDDCLLDILRDMTRKATQ